MFTPKRLGYVSAGCKFCQNRNRKDSDLPVKLAELGWNPIQCSSGTRITGRGLMPVDVIEITLGK